MTPWTAAHEASLSFTISWSLFNFMPIESMMPSNHLILYFPLLFMPSVFPRIQALVLRIKWPKYWSFGISISPSKEYSRLISFRLTGLILLSKELSRVFSSTTVRKHQFFSTHPFYGPALTSVHDYWKNSSFDYTDLCWKVISLLFNTLSRFNLKQSFVSFYFLHI